MSAGYGYDLMLQYQWNMGNREWKKMGSNETAEVNINFNQNSNI